MTGCQQACQSARQSKLAITRRSGCADTSVCGTASGAPRTKSWCSSAWTRPASRRYVRETVQGSRRDAEARLAELSHRRREHGRPRRPGVGIGSVISSTRGRETTTAHLKSVDPHRLQGDARPVPAPKFATLRIDKIAPLEVERRYRWVHGPPPLAPLTVRKVQTLAVDEVRHGRSMGWLADNPLRRVCRPWTGQGRQRAPEPEEVATAVAARGRVRRGAPRVSCDFGRVGTRPGPRPRRSAGATSISMPVTSMCTGRLRRSRAIRSRCSRRERRRTRGASRDRYRDRRDPETDPSRSDPSGPRVRNRSRGRCVRVFTGRCRRGAVASGPLWAPMGAAPQEDRTRARPAPRLSSLPRDGARGRRRADDRRA